MSFNHLPHRAMATRRHNNDKDFIALVSTVHTLLTELPQHFPYKLYMGSASWLGSEQDNITWQHLNDRTIWKACYYGTAIYGFGVRVRYAEIFQSLRTFAEWDRLFKVPPHHGDHQWFVGFAAKNDISSVNRIARVIRALNDELSTKSPPKG